MVEVRGLSYGRFRDGVVRGEVHDGNAFRRGGVSGHAGLFATARDVWALARVWLDPARREWTRDRTADLAEARGLGWQGRRGAGSAIPEMSDASFGHTGFTGTSVWVDPERDRVAGPADQSHPSGGARDPVQRGPPALPRAPQSRRFPEVNSPASMASTAPSTDVFILDGARTPMAEYNGAFADTSAIDLGVHAAAEALQAERGRAGAGRPRHLRQRPADLGGRDLRRPPRRPEGRRSERGPGPDGEPSRAARASSPSSRAPSGFSSARRTRSWPAGWRTCPRRPT